uniref:Uncharacterized protein n=1 Tax=Triticum urartu TaxID=4572 RepID=A0A8R7QSZ0_TRIUA
MRGFACSTVQVTPVDAPTACRRILLLLPMSHLAFSSVDKFATSEDSRTSRPTSTCWRATPAPAISSTTVHRCLFWPRASTSATRLATKFTSA